MNRSGNNRNSDPTSRIERVDRRAPTLDQLYERLKITPQRAKRQKKGERFASTLGDSRSSATRSRQGKLLHASQQDNALFSSLEKFARTGNGADL